MSLKHANAPQVFPVLGEDGGWIIWVSWRKECYTQEPCPFARENPTGR